MNIMENKKASLIAAAFAIGFGATMYAGYSWSAEANAANATLKKINTEFEAYNSQEYPPTIQSKRQLEKAYSDVKKINETLQTNFARYRDSCIAMTGKATPVAFQSDVGNSISQFAAAAKKANVQIAPAAANLGMSSYRSTAATGSQVNFLDFQFKATKCLANMLVESGVSKIDKIYCAPLPKECGENMRKAPAYFPMSMELAFSVNRGDIPRFTKKFLEEKKFFFTMTGISIESNIALAKLDEYVGPVGDAMSVLEDNTKPERIVAVQKTGLASETVKVYVSFDVLFFNELGKK